LGITGIEMSTIAPGHVLCDPEAPVPVVSRFQARIVTFGNLVVPIIQGFKVLCGCVARRILTSAGTVCALLHASQRAGHSGQAC